MICNDADMRARPPRLMGPNGKLHTPYNWDAAVSHITIDALYTHLCVDSMSPESIA
jgi:hypothetical protein